MPAFPLTVHVALGRPVASAANRLIMSRSVDQEALMWRRLVLVAAILAMGCGNDADTSGTIIDNQYAEIEGLVSLGTTVRTNGGVVFVGELEGVPRVGDDHRVFHPGADLYVVTPTLEAEVRILDALGEQLTPDLVVSAASGPASVEDADGRPTDTTLSDAEPPHPEKRMLEPGRSVFFVDATNYLVWRAEFTSADMVSQDGNLTRDPLALEALRLP